MTRTLKDRRQWLFNIIRKEIPVGFPAAELDDLVSRIAAKAFISIGEDDAEWSRVIDVFLIGFAFSDRVSDWVAEQPK